MIPKTIHRILQARTRFLSKRQTSSSGGLDIEGILTGLGNGLGATFGLQWGATTKSTKPPNSTVPEIQDTKSKFSDIDSVRRKIRYGPYRIPPTSENNLESQILQIRGMSNTFKRNARKPCKGECTILGVVADMEWADGTLMKTQDGILLNSGPKVVDANCGMTRVENMFMDGNEKTTNGFALPNSTVKLGYSLTPENSFILTTELMNLEDKEKWAWVTLTFEYLDGPHHDYKQGKTVWMTIGPPIGACGRTLNNPFGASNLTWTQQPKSERFIEHSQPWTSLQDGLILSSGGHMHDGGVNTMIFHNKEKICDFLPHYSFTKKTNSTSAAGGHGQGDMRKRQMGGAALDGSNAEVVHIERQDPCTFPNGIPIKKGDTAHLAVDYDFKKYPGMKNKKGELDEVMGIVGMLVAFG